MRKSFVAGNWKMNLDRRAAVALAEAVAAHAATKPTVEVALFPPFVYLADVARALAGSALRLGAQNVCDQAAGAFTGEISASMLLDVGAKIALIGHSERRHVYGEGDALLQKKVAHALSAGLDVMLCVGETLAEREAGRTEEIVRGQLKHALEGVSSNQLSRLSIAYEPVWAIGTGRNASPDEAQAVHSYLRGLLGGRFSPVESERMRILYGGSVKPDNAREIMGKKDIDGTLVGGASLQLSSFAAIIDSGK